MTDLIERLRTAAMQAIPVIGFDRWVRLFGERTVYTRDPNDGCRTHVVVRTDAHLPSAQEAAYLDFIALANPATITSLLDTIADRDREIARLTAELSAAERRGAERMRKLSAKVAAEWSNSKGAHAWPGRVIAAAIRNLEV